MYRKWKSLKRIGKETCYNKKKLNYEKKQKQALFIENEKSNKREQKMTNHGQVW